MTLPASIGEALRSLLAERSLGIPEAAEAVGITRQSLHAIIAGKGAPSPVVLERLLKLGKVPPGERPRWVLLALLRRGPAVWVPYLRACLVAWDRGGR